MVMMMTYNLKKKKNSSGSEHLDTSPGLQNYTCQNYMTIASVGLLRDTKLSYVSITIKMGTFSDPNVVQQKGVNLTFKGPQSLRR